MKLYVDSSKIGIKHRDTDLYADSIFLNHVSRITPDGQSFVIGMYKFPFSKFQEIINYVDITDYNDLGYVPSYADILSDMVSAKASSVSGGSVEVPSMTVLSSSVTIAAGAKSVTVVTDSSFTGTILGAVAAADSAYTYSAQAGNTLGSIAIVRSAGSFTILKTL